MERDQVVELLKVLGEISVDLSAISADLFRIADIIEGVAQREEKDRNPFRLTSDRPEPSTHATRPDRAK